MSAQELIKQVATLPPSERALFDNLLRTLHKNGSNHNSGNQSNWPDFGKRLHEIYGNKVALDSQAAIHEERGDR